jgi:5-formyltetrahydrofolate cyclo-ligase
MTAPASPPGKAELRAAVRARRSARSTAEQLAAALRFRDQLLALPEVAAASRVALFVSQDGEPGTAPFLEALHSSGVTVMLPILLTDFDLDWAPFEPDQLEAGRFGLLMPTTPRLGVDAISTVSVVVCPGVAVDRRGSRLGRGGGSYDRALARCPSTVLRCQLAYDDEVVDVVPTASHDQPVDLIATPTRVMRTSTDGR